MFMVLPNLALEKCFTSSVMIIIIFLFRKRINESSFPNAALGLWLVVALYLISPYGLKIMIHPVEDTGLMSKMVNTSFVIKHFFRQYIFTISEYFPLISRIPTAVVLLLYMVREYWKTKNALLGAEVLEDHDVVNTSLAAFPLRRKVHVYVNDALQVPITFGVFQPKIFLQSHVLEDDVLLSYVLLHELIHIKKLDILWVHFKYFFASIYWYNPFLWIATRYVDRDLELLCDKLVLKKVGDAPAKREEYSRCMLKLIQHNQKETTKFTMKLHPTVERIMTMKKWKVTFSGILVFTLAFTALALSFASIEEDRLPINNPTMQEEQVVINEGNRSTEITDEEYESLNLAELKAQELRAANIDQDDSLDAYGNNQYSFNMNNWYGGQHNSFVTKITNTACSDGVAYSVNIYENGRKIYSHFASRDLTITTTETHPTSSYKVVIVNNSGAEFTYHVKINSYIEY